MARWMFLKSPAVFLLVMAKSLIGSVTFVPLTSEVISNSQEILVFSRCEICITEAAFRLWEQPLIEAPGSPDGGWLNFKLDSCRNQTPTLIYDLSGGSTFACGPIAIAVNDLNETFVLGYSSIPLPADEIVISDVSSQDAFATDHHDPRDIGQIVGSLLVILSYIVKTLFSLFVMTALGQILIHKLEAIAAFIRKVLTSASRNWRTVVVYVTTLAFMGLLIWMIEQGVMKVFVGALIMAGLLAGGLSGCIDLIDRPLRSWLRVIHLRLPRFTFQAA